MTSSLVSIEKLTGSNYHTWKFDMKMMLMREELWAITNGKETLPKDGTSKDDVLQEWAKKDEKALATICLAIAKSEQSHVHNCTTAAQAWKRLSDIYETRATARKLYLWKRYFTS